MKKQQSIIFIDTHFYYNINCLQVLFDGKKEEHIVDKTIFIYDIIDDERNVIIEKCKKKFEDSWQIREKEWNNLINN